MHSNDVDVLIVGGGVAGLAHALAAAKAGDRVAVLERDQRAVGASVRNFGLIWPIGLATGTETFFYERALRSTELWREVVRDTGMWHSDRGSLHLAHRSEELAVLEEFLDRTPAAVANGVRLIGAQETLRRSDWVRGDGLLGALESPAELNIDPRVAIPALTELLRERYAVRIEFGALVTGIDHPVVHTSAGDWHAERIFVCSGNEFQALYPEVFAESGLRHCKLQMMRTLPQPDGFELGPALCAGLTLLHYPCFAECPSLPALRTLLTERHPFCLAGGIHVLVSQASTGQIAIGDSHHYELTQDPFQYAEIDEAILEYFDGFARLPRRRIAEHWHGIYPSPSDGSKVLLAQPEPGVTVVNGFGGAGMTLSLGVAEHILEHGTLRDQGFARL
ncbi:TIGR03364 family FAD-dependent oxidoreductase [Sciscionella marina]|uniref:TIGR03364 family FAD-dependent oxidoreductase n=1 Tax=Sciscionella marina TaxID=508770 RepID=UPI000372DA36|nr:TIGR03364 family FAD-dependent oxidoreductase [Sciscionella marina]